ncbi:MAG: hypothetical protein V7636_1565, partial [Actinomycetota bacterium]
MRIRGLLVVVALVLVGGVGCGGDDDDSSSGSSGSGDTLTATEFKTQGNAICKKGNDEIDAAGSKVFTEGQEPDKEVVRAFLKDSAIPNIRQQIDDVEALAAPDELAEGQDKLVASARKALKK